MAEPQAGKPSKKLELYFDIRDGSYLYDLGGRFVQMGKSDLRVHLKKDHGLTDATRDGIAEFDHLLYRIQKEKQIDFAGGLAGHRKGIFSDGSGRKFLVTEEANGVFNFKLEMPKPKFFTDFITELLPNDQHEFFCHWLAISLRSLCNGDFRPGQVPILAGPAGCGKSLGQDIVTEIFGGRSADPFRYMMELTQFNKDLCGAEHWKISDPPTTTDTRTRRAFGNQLKKATVDRDFSIHAKGKDALSLPLFRRVTISVNDEPENLAVCPPLDPSIEDKVFLFHCAYALKCFAPFRDDKGEVDRKAVWQAVIGEIPAIRAWLLKNFTAKKIPSHMRDDRFGIKSWHHPDLLAELQALAPETKFLQLIDDALFTPKDEDTTITKFEGKSSELEKQLRNSDVKFEVDKILRFVGACGSYLGKLAKSQPKRVSKRVSAGYATWTINPPPKENGK
jgi:hypothetical protein